MLYKTGHRGCRGIMPENTIIGFIEAIKYGCNAIEFDIVISQDRQLVVSHEPYMNPDICLTPDGEEIEDSKRYNLYKMNYDEIKNFDCGSKFNSKFPNQMKFKSYKPLLTETIESIEEYLKRYNLSPIIYDIEIKSDQLEYDTSQPVPEEIVDMLLSIIKIYNIRDKVIVRSFDKRPLQYLHIKEPTIKIAYLVENEIDIEQNLAELGLIPNFYSPKYTLITSKMLDFCKNINLPIIAWTVNTKLEIKNLIDMGVEGIITDYPNLF